MKRVLFVSYYFPPSGGSGVQRPLKMVKYLSEFGWDATVLTVDPDHASYSDIDESMTDEIPAGIRLIRSRALDPYAMYSKFMGRGKKELVGVGFTDTETRGFRENLARWIRGNIFIPDARVGWVKFAATAALQEFSVKPYDAVITTGPPHSTHLIGLRIKKKTGLPWIIDLRDAWPSDSYGHLIPVSRPAAAWDKRLRSKAFGAADRILSVSRSILHSTSILTKTVVELIPNGFDEDDFSGKDAAKKDPQGQEKFSIVFTGHMPDEQDPEALWGVIRSEKDAGRLSDLRVYLVGNVSRATLESIRRYRLEATVSVIPYVSHGEAIKWICGAHLLLLTINRVPNPHGIITGKLYEYLASGNPVLCLGPVGGDAADLIATAGAGSTFEHIDRSGIKATLGEHYEAWNSGHPMKGASTEAAELYSRRVQAGELASILTEISS